MAEIELRLGAGGYSIHVGSGIYVTAMREAVAEMAPARIMLVSHPELLRLHGERLEAALEGLPCGDLRLERFLFPPGEENKSMATLERGYTALLQAGLTREDVIIAFGGGVVGDLAGFMAASYMRGIRYIQVPTTLMAMVDSSIGGKVGIDLGQAKNAVGAFHHPTAVFSDVEVLRTLQRRDVASGLAEVAKYGFLFDPGLLGAVEECGGALPPSVSEIEEMVARCAEHKAAIVSRDERDTAGIRALLNYGHTFGHALESACGLGTLKHGEAVAVGMMMAARASELTGLAAEGLLELHRRILSPLLAYVSGTAVMVGSGEVVRHMQADKKRGRRMRFVLLEAPGKPRVVDELAERTVERAMDEIIRDISGVR